jgi:hypothetical protein
LLADNRFDAQTQRWFLTVLQLDVKPKTGSFSGRSHVLLAVSQTADPTKSFNLFRFDVTDDGAGGTPNHANCPCFGDQPLLGADGNGLFITTKIMKTSTSTNTARGTWGTKAWSTF